MDVRTETGCLSKMTTTCAVERISSVWSRNKIEGKNIIHNRPLFTKSVFVCRRKKCVTAKIHSFLHQGEWLAFGLPFYFASFWWIWPSGAVPNFVWAKQRKMDREVGMMARGKSRKLHTQRTRTQSKAFPSRSSCLDTKLIFLQGVCVCGGEEMSFAIALYREYVDIYSDMCISLKPFPRHILHQTLLVPR